MKGSVAAWLFASSTLVTLLCYPARADACTCQRFPDETQEQIRHNIESDFDGAAAVFAGEAAQRGANQAFRVETIWKGELGPSPSVRQWTPSPDGRTRIENSCDYQFQRGRKYLVFARRDPTGVLYASTCGFTAPLEGAAETIRALDAIAAIRRGEEPDAFARFLALEQSWMDALAARDLTALEALLSADFVSTGALSREPLGNRARWLQNAGGLPWPKLKVRLVKVLERGDVTIVISVLRGRFPPRLFTRDWGGDLSFMATDVWTRRGTAWQVLSRHLSLLEN